MMASGVGAGVVEPVGVGGAGHDVGAREEAAVRPVPEGHREQRGHLSLL